MGMIANPTALISQRRMVEKWGMQHVILNCIRMRKVFSCVFLYIMQAKLYDTLNWLAF